MPETIQPCLAVLKSKVPNGPEYLLEIKFDGFRLSVYKRGSEVRVRTKNGLDWTHKFPDIVAATAALTVETIILDGEAVVLDDIGRTDFNALQKALGPGKSKAPATGILFCAFDVLYFDGHDLRSLSLEERRIVLKSIIPEQPSALLLSQEIEGDRARLMTHICGLGLEGVIAKDRYSTYRSGKSGDWLKIKCVQSETFAVIGFYPASGGVARLLVAAKRDGKLTYVGSVGSGLSERMSRILRGLLDKRLRKTAVTPTSRHAIFTRPEVLVEVKFRGWTSDGKLRQPSFKTIRAEEDEAEVFEIGVDGTK